MLRHTYDIRPYDDEYNNSGSINKQFSLPTRRSNGFKMKKTYADASAYENTGDNETDEQGCCRRWVMTSQFWYTFTAVMYFTVGVLLWVIELSQKNPTVPLISHFVNFNQVPFGQPFNGQVEDGQVLLQGNWPVGWINGTIMIVCAIYSAVMAVVYSSVVVSHFNGFRWLTESLVFPLMNTVVAIHVGVQDPMVLWLLFAITLVVPILAFVSDLMNQSKWHNKEEKSMVVLLIAAIVWIMATTTTCVYLGVGISTHGSTYAASSLFSINLIYQVVIGAVCWMQLWEFKAFRHWQYSETLLAGTGFVLRMTFVFIAFASLYV